MYSKAFVVSLTLFLVLVQGCSKQWNDPNTSIPAWELTVASLLISPIAYDSAGVTVKGRVWDVSKNITYIGDKSIEYTVFKLADSEGNYVGVYSPGHIEVIEGDNIKVTGLFRRNLKRNEYYFENEIEALEIEIGK